MKQRSLNRIVIATMFCSLVMASPTIISSSGEHPKTTRGLDESIEIEFEAGFLEAGLQKNKARRGTEIEFGPVEWLSTTKGTVVASLWKVRAKVTFELAEDNGLKTVSILPWYAKTQGLEWDVWRHRHGYIYYPTLGYVWNSLEDLKPGIPPDQGKAYDAFLEKVWGYWVSRRLPAHLALGSSAQRPRIDLGLASETRAKIPVRVRVDDQGALRPVNMVFQINVWQVPVKIYFQVHNSKEPASSGLSIAGRYHWKFDMDELRRRHGYKRDFWSGYAWAEGFPDKSSLTKADGVKYDEFLERGVAYWVDVAAEQVMSDFNHKFVSLTERGITPRS